MNNKLCYKSTFSRIMRKFLFFFIALGISLHISAQNTTNIFGRVADEQGNGVAFANVVLLNPIDSVLKHGAMCDLDGYFSMDVPQQGEYIFFASCIGYQTHSERITVEQSHELNITLKQDVQQVDEIVVAQQRVSMEVDKSSFLITAQERKNRQTGIDLLNVVPKLEINPTNNSITTTNGGAVKLLINGRSASEIELQTVRPADVLRIEHYDVPPARYAAYEAVVNLIVRQPENGLLGMVSSYQAFTTGYNNSQIYLKYNHNKHQFLLSGYMGYRNYRHRISDVNYEYELQGAQFKRSEQADDAFGYTQFIPGLYYMFMDSLTSAMLSFGPAYTAVHSNGAANVDMRRDGVSERRTRKDFSERSEFNPAVGSYFAHRFTERDELVAELVGTQFGNNTTYGQLERRADSSIVYDNAVLSDDRKRSIMGELFYEHQLGFGASLKLGYSGGFYHLRTDQQSALWTGTSIISSAQHYGYAELVGRVGPVGYDFAAGYEHLDSRTADNRYVHPLLRANAMLSMNIGTNQMLRLSYRRRGIAPSLAQLSSSVSYIADNMLYSGNPMLVRGVSNRLGLDYSLNLPWLSLNLAPYANRISKVVNTYFCPADSLIIRRPVNDNDQIYYGLSYDLRFNPLQWLSFSVFGSVNHVDVNSSQIGRCGFTETPINAGFDVSYKTFRLSCSTPILTEQFNAGYISSNNDVGVVELSYFHNTLTVSAQCLWPLTEATYKSRTPSGSPVAHTSHTHIRDNASMFVLGIRYFFGLGRFTQETVNQRISNSDNDSGVFYGK